MRSTKYCEEELDGSLLVVNGRVGRVYPPHVLLLLHHQVVATC
jgi:hypothetical protein